MLLISLELENVRSYRRARISFPKGRILLSGDIGAGKSTILLAVEFALFGLVRGWNDGEKLLRHGASNARVKLTVDIDGVFTIERSLKRTNTGIGQEEVIITEDHERRVTPSEARSFVIARLGYPDAFTTKQPVLFRYTIFTPQESMKQIIEERPDARLGAVRTIFGIDRYESIASNAQIVVRSLRHSSALLSGRLERKTAVLEAISETREAREANARELEEAKRELAKARTAHEEASQHLEKMRSLAQEEHAKSAQRARLLDEQKQLGEELESLIAERSGLTIEQIEVPDLDSLEDRASRLDETIEEIDRELEQVREERSSLSEHLARSEENRSNIGKELEELEEKSRAYRSFHERIASRIERFARFDAAGVRARLEELERIVSEVREERARIDERIRSATERLESIPEDTCPTCGQRVDTSHRESAIAQIRSSIGKDTHEAKRLESRLEELAAERERLSSRLASFEELEEKRRNAPEDPTKRIEERKTQLERVVQVREKARERLASIDTRIEELARVRAERIAERGALKKKLKHARELRVRAERAKYAKERREQIDKRMRAIREKLELIEKSIPEKDPLIEERFKSAKSAFEAAQAERTRAQGSVERIEERKSALEERDTQFTEELRSLKRYEQKRDELDMIGRFLSGEVPDLAGRIESAIMRRILIETNDRFSKWFSLLVEDLEAYLDDRFTPRIMQSGYDISFENLSGGERTSISLAYRLALHETINHLTGQSSSGLLILDEPTDGFSSEQLESVREVLAQLRSQQVVIVSHEPAMEGFVDEVVRIERQAQESVIR